MNRPDLKCPRCRAPVDFSAARCPTCEAVYQEVFEARASAGRNERTPRRARRRRPRHLLGAAALSALCALLCAWRMSAPPGLPLPPQAVDDPVRGFAFAAPEGWTVNLEPRGVAELVSAARLTDGITSVEVLRGPRALYGRARSEAAVLAQSQFNGSEVRLDSVEEIQVDRLPAFRLEVSGGRVYLPSPSAGQRASAMAQPNPRYESLEFAGELILVPGSGCSYLLKVDSNRDELRRRREVIDAFLDSFRVTRRPLLAAFF